MNIPLRGKSFHALVLALVITDTWPMTSHVQSTLQLFHVPVPALIITDTWSMTSYVQSTLLAITIHCAMRDVTVYSAVLVQNYGIELCQRA